MFPSVFKKILSIKTKFFYKKSEKPNNHKNNLSLRGKRYILVPNSTIIFALLNVSDGAVATVGWDLTLYMIQFGTVHKDKKQQNHCNKNIFFLMFVSIF